MPTSDLRVYPAKMVPALARFAARAALRTIAYLMLAFGLAALPMVWFLRGSWPAAGGLLEAVGTGWAWMGAVAGVGGLAGTVLLGRAPSLMRRRRRAVIGHDPRAPGGTLPYALSALAVVAVGASQPLVALWRDTLVLFERWDVWQALSAAPPETSGFVLLPMLPFLFAATLEAMALVACIASSTVLVVEHYAASPGLRRTLAGCVVLQVALVVETLLAIGWTHGLYLEVLPTLIEQPGDEGARAIASWFARFETTAEPMVLRFAVLAAGYGLCTSLIAPARGEAPGPRDLPEPAAPEATRAASSRPPSLLPLPEVWHRHLAHPAYVIRPRYPLLAMILRLPGGYEIFAPAGGLSERIVFVATEEGGPIHGILRVQAAPPDDGELMLIHRRRRSLTKREVTVTAGGTVLAVIRTGGVGDAGWTIEDSSGAVMCEVVQVVLVPRLATYEIRVGGAPACRVVWTLRGLLRPELEITFFEEAAAVLDKRLGLALGLTLEGHARFATHVASS